ncbi:MAG: polyvinylalcohol dehydrogenase [Opitutae bacterium]|nr:polyvinylalcohol dehydrogenase [Opitutae bacterium]|tara:strand:+ start:2742 stop:3974 length:1233 start_codon:yes stop_codon:yes gene_type:complete
MKFNPFFFSFLFALCNATSGTDWPGWRGSERNDVSKETGLLQSWPEGGPEKIWMNKLGGLGYSGFSITNGILYTMGAFGDEERLLAFDANSGKKVWELKTGDLLKNNWGDGPRMTPSVSNGLVYSLGGRGNLICANAKDGKKEWSVHLVEDLGGKVPGWGYTESVLIDQGRVICTPGGEKGALAALDAKTGKVLWRSKAFTDGAQYSSPIVIENQSKRQYVQLVMKNLVGIEATSGKLLWKSSWPGKVAVIPTPVYSDNHVYVSSGYGVGCKLVELAGSSPVDVYENKVMKNHHGGVIKLGDYLYGYSDGYGWVCQNFKNGELKWNEKKSLGKGAIAYADNRFYCLGEGDGRVILIEATPEGWKAKGEFTITPQTEQRNPKGKVWTHPVISNGKLYLRDQELIFCYDIKR